MSWKLGLGSAQGFTGEWREGLVKRTRLVWETYFLTICEVALESAHSGHSESAESMTANGGRKGSESWLTCMGSVQKDVSLLLSSRRTCIFRCIKIIKIKHQDQQLHIIRVVWWCYKSHWWVLIIVPRVRFPRGSISLCYQVFQAVQVEEGGLKAWEGLYWKCSVPMSLSLVFLWLSLSLLSLIFVIVLCVNLTSPQDMQTSGYRLFLRMFPQKVSIESVNWIKAIVFLNVGGYHPVHWGLNGTKWWGKEELAHSLFAWLLKLKHWSSVLDAPDTQVWLKATPWVLQFSGFSTAWKASLDFQLADGR